jgi:hypothetical protein
MPLDLRTGFASGAGEPGRADVGGASNDGAFLRKLSKMERMPDAGDAVEKLLAEQKAFEDRRKQLIEELLRQKEAAIKDFDEKLAKLGYQAGPKAPGRSHHRKPAGAPEKAGAKEKGKAE